jgi:hypothetical protein
MPRIKRPCVDWASITHEVKQAGLGELLGGPLVQALKSRHDHGVVEQPAEAVLVGKVVADLFRKRRVVWQHAATREERTGHAESGIAEQPAEWGEQSYRQARRPDKCMRVKHAAQCDVQEEALCRALCLGERMVLQVAGDDAGAVSPVPRGRGWPLDELQSELHRL